MMSGWLFAQMVGGGCRPAHQRPSNKMVFNKKMSGWLVVTTTQLLPGHWAEVKSQKLLCIIILIMSFSQPTASCSYYQ
jgi:hypothetical protein